MKRVAVIGAGITGLTLAFELQRKGAEVVVFESGGHAGGAIRTVRQDGFLLESGPNSVLAGGEAWDYLMDSLQLRGEVQEANSVSKKRFIAREGRMVCLPASPLQFFSSDFLSPAGKLRLIAEPFAGRKSGSEDESLADFVRRRFGQEALDYLFNPFVCGIYAGRPEELSVRHAFPMLAEAEERGGSVTLGMIGRMLKSRGKPRVRKKMLSFKNGMQTLPLKMAAQLGGNLRLHETVVSVSREGGRWSLGLKSGVIAGLFDAVVTAVPAYQLPGLGIEGLKAEAGHLLSQIPYAPVRVWHLGFRRTDVSHVFDGFGLLIPEKENKTTLGVIFSSTLFPGRSADDLTLLTVFTGGARKPEVLNWESSRLREVVLEEIDYYCGKVGRPVLVKETVWPRAIPQMIPGYGVFLRTMENAEKELPGLYLAGSYRGGISVLNCIENGLHLARCILDR